MSHSPSAADLKCIGYEDEQPDNESPKESEKSNAVDLRYLASLRHQRRQREQQRNQIGGTPDDQPEMNEHSTPGPVEALRVEADYPGSLLRKESSPDVAVADIHPASREPSDGDLPPIPTERVEEITQDDDHSNMSIEDHRDVAYYKNIDSIMNKSDNIRPAVVMKGTSLYLRLEKRDYLKVRKTQPFFSIGVDTTSATTGESPNTDCFSRIRASNEQCTIGYDTRNIGKHWVPIPMSLFGGKVLIDKELPFVFLSSRTTTCKIATVESRTYPTKGAVKFEIENFDPAERFIATLVEECTGLKFEGSPSTGIPSAFFASAMNSILTNPSDKLNQIGGGIILVTAPTNTLRLRLDSNDTIAIQGTEVIAWTQGIRFVYRSSWLGCRRTLSHIKGPGTVWIAASLLYPNSLTMEKDASTNTL